MAPTRVERNIVPWACGRGRDVEWLKDRLNDLSDLSLVDVQKQTTDIKYVVAMDCDETSIVVYQEEEPHWTVTVNLTCPAVRQQTDEGLCRVLSLYDCIYSVYPLNQTQID